MLSQLHCSKQTARPFVKEKQQAYKLRFAAKITMTATCLPFHFGKSGARHLRTLPIEPYSSPTNDVKKRIRFIRCCMLVLLKFLVSLNLDWDATLIK